MRPDKHLFIFGYPHHVGGAGTELWHSLQLWRRAGFRLTCVPTGPIDPAWRQWVASIGVETVEAAPDAYQDIPGLPGAVVVAFCNVHFTDSLPLLHGLGCRSIFLPCMNWVNPRQLKRLPEPAPIAHRIVCQSHYQRNAILARYQAHARNTRQPWSDERCLVIRGAYCRKPFRQPPIPKPHGKSEPFVVGRLSRAQPDKFPQDLWRQYAKILHTKRALVMGWSPEVEAVVGPVPPWAETVGQDAMPAREFYDRLHCVAPGVRAPAIENWPRVGLEAMELGVPLVVEDRGGWPEMVRHGHTGYVCASDEEAAYWLSVLAHDERRREAIVRAAFHWLVEVADEERWIADWTALLESLSQEEAECRSIA